jgi:hypothetical protein
LMAKVSKENESRAESPSRAGRAGTSREDAGREVMVSSFLSDVMRAGAPVGRCVAGSRPPIRGSEGRA